jgi:MFS family permease
MSTQIGTLVIATSIIQLANGFFGTLFSLRVAIEDFDTPGLVLSAYFAGFTLGAFRCGKIIERVGHIRAYAAFAGLVSIATGAIPLVVESYVWIILRAIVGFGCAGIFITTESWLNAKALPSDRGKVFSIYMVGTFIALALGQLMIAQADVKGSSSFSIIATLFAAGLVIVTMARVEPPQLIAAATLPLGALIREAPVAVIGSSLSGLVGGTFYALVPAWMQNQDIERTTIALFMLSVVLGGLAFQIPVGRLSDRFDRRIVLTLLGIGFSVIGFVVVISSRSLQTMLPEAVLLGGFMSTLYPVCVTNAHDRMPADRVVAVSGWLILASGVGSILGPLIGASLKPSFGIDGVFYFMIAATIILAITAILGICIMSTPKRLESPFKIMAPQAGPLAHDLLETKDS